MEKEQTETEAHGPAEEPAEKVVCVCSGLRLCILISLSEGLKYFPYAGFDVLGTLVHVLCSYRFEAALLLCPCSGVFHGLL